MSLCGGEAVQSDGLCSVMYNALTELEYDAQVELRYCMPLGRCKAEQSHSLCMVLCTVLLLLLLLLLLCDA